MRYISLCAVTAIGLLAPSVSEAAVATVTFTGTIYYDYNSNTSAYYQYTGKTLTETVTYDLANGYNYNAGSYTYSQGGSEDPISSPILSVYYSVSGGPSGTIDFSNAYYSKAYFQGNQNGGSGEQYTYADGPNGYTYAYVYGPNVPQFGNGTAAGGDGYQYVGDYSTGQYIDASALTVTSGVPEPGTWAMMLLGFCGLGFLAYRKASDGRDAPIIAA